jgi:F0F1-type ATP synthase assembly protein I
MRYHFGGGIAYSLLVGVLGGTFSGWVIDYLCGTLPWRWPMAAGFILGFAAALYYIWRHMEEWRDKDRRDKDRRDKDRRAS